MADVTLRFYGRFVYADGGDSISVLAPNFDEKTFGKHHVFMTIRRDQVAFGPELTTLPSNQRHVSPGPIQEAELLVWDLTGRTVTYQSKGPVDLVAATENNKPLGDVISLPELEKLQNRDVTLKPEALQPSATGVTRAVFEITNGRGVASPVITDPVHKVHFAAHDEVLQFEAARLEAVRLAKNPPDVEGLAKKIIDGSELTKRPADLVEFVVPVPGEDGNATFTLNLGKIDGADVEAVVTVKGNTIVAFSNLCAEVARRRDFDLEFAQYYALLSNTDKDMLIPVEPPLDQGGLVEGMDCDIQARVRRG